MLERDGILAKIIKISDTHLFVGDEGEVIEVSKDSVDFYPRVGDEVDVFRRNDEVLVYPKDSSQATKNAEPINIHIQNSNNSVNTNSNTNMNGAYGVPLGKPVNKIAYVLLALLLGFFGAQKFYAGLTGKGLLNLALCWTGIPFFIGIIDGIKGLLAPADAYGRIYVYK